MPAAPAPQHLFSIMLARVRAACAAVLGPQADLSRVVVEPPRDASHGDMATNAAMVLAKDAGKKPRELAEAIAERLRADDKVAKVDVAGPGFINLTLKAHVWGEELRVVLAAGADYGRSTMGAGEKVNVEYVSANPPRPMHVGHGRGAVFGDALAAEHGASLTTKPESEWRPLVRAKAIAMMMDMIRDDLAALNVRHDVFFSERSLIDGKTDQVTSTIVSLQKTGEVYE